MGVPQRRERVFFIAMRKDLAMPFLEQKDMFTQAPKLQLEFNDREIPFKNIRTYEIIERKLDGQALKDCWDKRKYGDRDFSNAMEREYNKPNKFFSYNYLYDDKVMNTITAKAICVVFDEPRYLNKLECQLGGSYPLDYDFRKNKPEYLIGMSVPPIMTARIADEIYNQWLKQFTKNDTYKSI
jgi:DNA (cytosine-5)-methyltransferase 1